MTGVSIKTIQDTTCAVFGVTRVQLLGSQRARRLATPRQVAMALSAKLSGQSLPGIGRAFGDRDHTTVLHAQRAIDKRRTDDAALNEMICKIEDQLLTHEHRGVAQRADQIIDAVIDLLRARLMARAALDPLGLIDALDRFTKETRSKEAP